MQPHRNIAQLEGIGGESSLTKLAGEFSSLAQNRFLSFGLHFESAGTPLKILFLSETARP
jgi:hypothetical protein